MTVGLYISAALVGFTASPHCIAMCGALCEKAAKKCRSSAGSNFSASHFISYLPVLLGRLASYAIAGALFGMVTSSAASLFNKIDFLKPLWLVVQLFIVFIGLWMLWDGKFPESIQGVFERVAKFLKIPKDNSNIENTPLSIIKSWIHALGIGSMWALFPCGVLHSVFLIASLSSGPIDGAFVLLSFGLASSISLYAGGWLWRMFLEGNPAPQSPTSQRGMTGAWQRGLMSFRLAGASVVGAGAWSLFNMLSAVASPSVQCG